MSGQQATLCWQSDNGEISAYEGVECKSRLYIENAVRARYEGDFMEVWQGVEELEQYIRRQKFLQITDAYCMVLYGLDNVEDLKNTIVNIYCGVSKNQL